MGSQKKFAVVNFEDGMQIVPSKWLSKDNKFCKYPRTTSLPKMKDYVKNLENPGDHWDEYEVVKIYAYSNSYCRGMMKLKKAQYESDGFSNTEGGDEDSEDDLNVTPSQTIPEYPQLPDNVVMLEASQKTDAVMESEHQSKKIFRAITLLNFKIDNLCDNQVEILKRLDQQHNSENVLDDTNHELPELPLVSEDQLKTLEDKLKEADFRIFLLADLKKSGELHVSEVVRRVLTYLFTNSLAEKFSLMGMKRKRSFASLALCKIIFDVVRLHFEDATDHEIGRVISTWLRHAKERNQKLLK